ncbi:archaemetzincin family Zn-dependent metalloprotease [Flavobacterium sharifuzzamanii]|uniref:archaemetzincin family Zn-dependent metalloprotease n=1 Tax=Flavobacterium sharifuzzamanii TaxID=2211133 RepID=UPI000DADC053|nr:archaemetzincin family Zn-dependent metalloprotease [Flavobacterium sharifuzzamanii]KAF2081953.1 archaemetzincin family Zn-dependent metalloprotease [Flavobacterium sharifuzzamanii]
MKKLLLLVFVIFLSCQSDKKEKTNLKTQSVPQQILPPQPYFVDIKVNDVKLGKPAFGDWLFSHKENGQSFEKFVRNKHVVPTKEENIIYLQPIGKFDSMQIKQIELVRQYLQIFFQLETKVLENVSNDIIPNHARRIGDVGQEQFLAGYILTDVLKEENPNKRIALMAITEKDLYPKPEWNYVFGLASYRDKIAVSSMYRMQKEADFNLGLERLLKICSHEIGHMFGLYHCIEASCVMNGTNSMVETDRHSIRLCSLCQRKLNSGFNYDNVKRLKELEKYFKDNQLTSGVELMEKDLKSIQ